MARIDDLLPPSEIIRWASPKTKSVWPIFGWGILAGGGVAWFSSMLKDATEPGLLLFAAIGMAGIGIVMVAMQGFNRAATAKLAVTETHIVWVDGMGGDGDGKAALHDITAIDAEEGGATLNLSCNGETHRIEEIGGDVEGAARATGRPARVWRECKAPGALQARRWRLIVAVSVAGATAGGTIALAFMILGDDGVGRFIGAMAAALLAQWFAKTAKDTLPHFLVGRTLTGEERRDFVGWMTDLRWQGVKPDGPDDERLSRSRLGEWAMRKAYGEIPDLGEREPEILIPGEFPPD